MTIDVKQFLNTKFTGGANATVRKAIPIGEWKAVVDDVKLETFPGKKDPTKTYLRCTMFYRILDEKVLQEMGREKVIAVDGWLVDLTEGGDIDFGTDRNIDLGRVREATDCNKPGDEWSFPGFKDKIVKIKMVPDNERFKLNPDLYGKEVPTMVSNVTRF